MTAIGVGGAPVVGDHVFGRGPRGCVSRAHFLQVAHRDLKPGNFRLRLVELARGRVPDRRVALVRLSPVYQGQAPIEVVAVVHAAGARAADRGRVVLLEQVRAEVRQRVRAEGGRAPGGDLHAGRVAVAVVTELELGAVGGGIAECERSVE